MTKKTKSKRRVGPSVIRDRLMRIHPSNVTQERIDAYVDAVEERWAPKYSAPSRTAKKRLPPHMLEKLVQAGILVEDLKTELGKKSDYQAIKELFPWAVIPPQEGRTIPELESELFKYRYVRKRLMEGSDVDFVDPERLSYTPPLPDMRIGSDEDLEDLIFWAQERKETEDLDKYWREAKARKWSKNRMNEMFGGEDV